MKKIGNMKNLISEIVRKVNVICQERGYKHVKAKSINGLIVVDNIFNFGHTAASICHVASGFQFNEVTVSSTRIETVEVEYYGKKTDLPIIRKEGSSYTWKGVTENKMKYWVQPFDREMIPGSAVMYQK